MKRSAWFTLVAGLLAFLAPVVAQAQGSPGCAALCAVSCVKPFSIPDRWDDVTAIAGYMGGARTPNWRNNGAFDRESFTDLNANGLWNSGEPFTDGNLNGRFDAEAYGPLTTGYIADPNSMNPLAPAGDLGLELTLKANSSLRPSPGQYSVIDLPPINRGVPVTGGSEFRYNLASCNPSLVGPGDRCQLEPGNLVGPANEGMRNLIAQDPDAYWDPISQQVEGSRFPVSPRMIFVAAHDPRLPLSSGVNTITVTKVIPFFMEQMVGNAEVRGRFLRATTTGQVCSDPSQNAGFILTCPTPAARTSWGKVKSVYR